MQLQRVDRQNLVKYEQQSDDQSFECKQTLDSSTFSSDENRFKQCGCRCRCNFEDMMEDPLEKKRKKRKESKRRQKQKLRRERELALLNLQKIIREIYSLKLNFRTVQGEIERCLTIENNRDRICEFINCIIRDQVEIVRKEISQIISKYDPLTPGTQHEAIVAIFAPIRKVAQASEEIEKLINLFVNQFSEEEQTPLQKNFGRTTLKYINNTELRKYSTFEKIQTYIFQALPQVYPIERELVTSMLHINDSEEDNISESSDTEEGLEDYYDDEDQWEEQLSTIESQKGNNEHDHEHVSDKKKKKRKQRRRKLKEDIDQSYEAICKRTEQLQLEDSERSICNVTEDCLARISKRKWKYLSKSQK